MEGLSLKTKENISIIEAEANFSDAKKKRCRVKHAATSFLIMIFYFPYFKNKTHGHT